MHVRKALSGLLVVLGCLLAMAAVVVRWTDAQLQTDAYAQAVGPLLQRPEVKALIHDAVSEAIDASGRDIPPQMQAVVEQQVDTFVDSPLAAELWREATVVARDAVVDGTGSQVTVNVDDLALELRKQLAERGIEVPAPPETKTSVVLMDSPAVAQIRDFSELAGRLAPVLPFLAGGLLLLAVLVSPRRWATVAACGFGVAIGMGVGLAILPLAEQLVVADLNDERAQAIVLPAYQAFAASLRSDLLWVLVLALAVGLVGLVLAVVTGRRREPHALGRTPEPGYH